MFYVICILDYFGHDFFWLLKETLWNICYKNGILQHHQMLAIICNNRNLHSLLVGMQTGTLEGTLKDSLAIYYKAKPTLTILIIWSSNHSPWHLSKWFEILHPPKNLHIMFMETTKISFNRWMKKKNPHGISYIMEY